MHSLPIIGLVGGIGSGKSHIAKLFAKHGAAIIDADHFAHQALREPAIKHQLMHHWGPSIFTPEGQVDRKKLGAIVFRDPQEKARLESIVLPYIGDQIRSAIRQFEQAAHVPLAVLDAAILLETGWKSVCTALVFVDAPLELRINRVKSRGWDEAELHRREAAQWNLEKKKQLCDVVIPNFGDELLLERLVNETVIRYARPCGGNSPARSELN